MGGEFLVDDVFGVQPAIGGGNLLMLGRSGRTALRAASGAADAMRDVAGVFLPFPRAWSGLAARWVPATRA